ncbi:hypothetical protein NEFER03_1753, partial [Nematocida sp. LUAm3]
MKRSFIWSALLLHLGSINSASIRNFGSLYKDAKCQGDSVSLLDLDDQWISLKCPPNTSCITGTLGIECKRHGRKISTVTVTLPDLVQPTSSPDNSYSRDPNRSTSNMKNQQNETSPEEGYKNALKVNHMPQWLKDLENKEKGIPSSEQQPSTQNTSPQMSPQSQPNAQDSSLQTNQPYTPTSSSRPQASPSMGQSQPSNYDTTKSCAGTSSSGNLQNKGGMGHS